MRVILLLLAIFMISGPTFGASDAEQTREAAVAKAKQDIDVANKTYASAVDRMIKDATKAGKTDRAEALRKERDEALAVPVAAIAAAASPQQSASSIVVQSARYGRAPTWIDSTAQIASGVHGDQLKIASNLAGFLGKDPVPGNKFLEMNCLINGTAVQMRFLDSDFENPTITVNLASH